MKLLIVESPGKIKKLKSILGADWNVMASLGHVRDLPIKELGVSAPDFKPMYEATAKGKEVLSKLKQAVAKTDEIYLATDPDREGEAIAWHLKDALKIKNSKRVSFTSITESEVKKEISNARQIDMNLVSAQEARRVLDRLCGYLVSPALSKSSNEKLSAGRVQSPAVSLVVAKEKAIKSFVTIKHYGVESLFDNVENIQNGWKSTWKVDNFLHTGEEYILDKSLAEKIATIKTFTVKEFTETEKKQAPPAPFTTSTLQQASSNALKFNPKTTMQVAQKLYENGHITYMRTDSPNLSEDAIKEVFAYCSQNNLPRVEKARTWASKDSAQEAHECIRPTHIEAENIEGSEDEKALYQLIRLRVLASQLEEAIFSVRSVKLSAELEGEEVLFTAQGRTMLSQGWKMIFEEDQAQIDNEEENEVENSIPALKEGNLLSTTSSKVLEKKTNPPTRYTQASLIRELEKKGIGRPATYASILDNIMSKEYIKEEKRKLHATPKGEHLIELMGNGFTFLDLEFTEKMENQLDSIAQGNLKYFDVISNAHKGLEIEVKNFLSVHKPKINGEESEFLCQTCNAPLIKRPTKNGGFWFGCSAYPKCKERYWADEDGKPKFEQAS